MASERRSSSGKTSSAKKSTSSGKSSSGGKTSTKSKNTAKTKNKNAGRSRGQKSTQKSGVLSDILLLLLIAFALLLVLSNLNLGGSLLNSLGDFTFGLLGWMSFIFPFYLVFAVILAAANPNNWFALRKIVSSAALLVLVGSFIHLFSGNDVAEKPVSELYAYCSLYRCGGGLVSGALAKVLIDSVSFIGAVIVLVILALIALVVFTQRSFFAFIMPFLKAIGLFLYDFAGGMVSLPEAAQRLDVPLRKKREEEEWSDLEEYRVPSQYSRFDELDEQEQHELRLQNIRKNALKRSALPEAVPAPHASVQIPQFLKPAAAKKTAAPVEDLDYDDDFFAGEEEDESLDAVLAENQKEREARSLARQKAAAEREANPRNSFLSLKGFSLNPEDGEEDPDEEEFDDLLEMEEDSEPQEPQAPKAPVPEPAGPRPAPKRSTGRAAAGRKSGGSGSDAEEPARTAANRERKVSVNGIEFTEPDLFADAKPRNSDRNIAKEKQEEKKEEEQENKKEEEKKDAYVYPSLSLLSKPSRSSGDSKEHLWETKELLEETFRNFGVNVKITDVSCGPTVTRYELHPESGVKVSRILNLTDDIKLNLAVADIRIEAPIPGKAAIGIEVPNKTNSTVALRELLASEEFTGSASRLTFAVGKDIAGKPVVADIARMPHVLIAGATGAGKSVCINTLIMSILFKASPEEVRLIMVDPKVVELSVYNGIPHLLIPVVTDPKKAAGALNWAVQEMTKRYNTFAEYHVRNLAEYNRKVASMEKADGKKPDRFPQIVIIVDELADLMMVAPGEVEDAICRLAQLARAAGIHLVIATQRPSVNVITGLIKANMPSRIAFAVTSGVDSRTILDMNGAEKLLGKGDMLFFPNGSPKPSRVQGAFVSDDEVSAVVEFLTKKNPEAAQDMDIEESINRNTVSIGSGGGPSDERDSYFAEAGRLIVEKEKASIGMLQRMYKIGFNRAARIMDQLASAGVVGPDEGNKPRKILMTPEQFENYLSQNG